MDFFVSLFNTERHQLITWLSLISLLFFVGSLIIIPFVVARLPTDYFVKKKRQPASSRTANSYWQVTIILIKNVAGILLILAGIAMLILPGQGLLSILIGLSLSNFPGKFTLERRLVKIPSIFKGLNWLRKRKGKSALQIPE